jgi:hypothetical protein
MTPAERIQLHHFNFPTVVQELPNHTMERPLEVEIAPVHILNFDPDTAAPKGLHMVASQNKLRAEEPHSPTQSAA